MSETTVGSAEPTVGAPAAPQPAEVSPSEAETQSMSDAYDKMMNGTPAEPDAPADRDDKGRFKPSDDAPKKEAKAEPSAEDAIAASLEGEDAGADKETGTPPPLEPVLSAPAHFPAELRAEWGNMPETAQKAVADHISSQHAKFGEQGRELESYKGTRDVVKEFNEYFDGTKASYKPDEAMRYLFNLQRSMDADPLNTLLQVADTYGLRKHLTQPTDATKELAALRQTVLELRNQAPEDIDSKVTQALDHRDSLKAITDFADSKEFFADVEAQMPAFIEIAKGELGDNQTPTALMEAAYNMAVEALPSVRAKRDAAKEAAEKLAAEKAAPAPDPKRTEKARKAASINVKSTSTGQGHQMSEDEALSAAYDRARAN